MPDYALSKIYEIVNTVNAMKYIGSTSKKLLCSRMAEHRSNNKKVKCDNIKLYGEMKTIGVENFKIRLIEKFPCTSIDELAKRESEVIQACDPDTVLNMRNPFNPECEQQYYQRNKDKICIQAKKHYQAMKVKLSTKVHCDICDTDVSQSGLSSHNKTIKHINNSV